MTQETQDYQNLKANIAEPAGYSHVSDSEIDLDAPKRDFRLRAKKLLSKFLYLTVSLHIVVLPLMFGGVHEKVFLCFRLLSFSALILLLAFDFSGLRSSLSTGSVIGKSSVMGERSVSSKMFLALILCFLFTCLHTAFAYYFLQPEGLHPVLINNPGLLKPLASISQLCDFAHYLSLFVITVYIINKPASGNLKIIGGFINLIVASALLVSLTALAHWFYDNGRLFWIFSPNYESVSNRARWPFVNPNHLAIYLALAYFLSLSRAEQSWLRIKQTAQESLHRGNLVLSDFLSNRASQSALSSVLLNCILLLVFSLTIIASLSRNAGINILLFTILFLLLPRSKKSSLNPIPQIHNELQTENPDQNYSRPAIRRRKSSGYRTSEHMNAFHFRAGLPAIKFLVRAFALGFVLWLIFFFLGEKGGELFKSRIEYALIYTQDDMRWQMYTDSLPMFLDYHALGIGLANWAAVYPAYMSRGLSGMEPAYLHSDSLQLLLELGLPGAMIFMFALYQFIRIILRSTKAAFVKRRMLDLSLLRGFLCSVCCVVICSCFEFPFRIPAITSLFFIFLALPITLIDKLHSGSAENNQL